MVISYQQQQLQKNMEKSIKYGHLERNKQTIKPQKRSSKEEEKLQRIHIPTKIITYKRTDTVNLNILWNIMLQKDKSCNKQQQQTSKDTETK